MLKCISKHNVMGLDTTIKLISDADSDADSKWIVRVPYIHAEDVPVVGNFRNFAR